MPIATEKNLVFYKYMSATTAQAVLGNQTLRWLRISDERDRPFRDGDRRFRQRDRAFRERDRADRKAGLALRMKSTTRA
ncbi:MAG TPA: hypothetical protein VF534_14895, partial [Paraburkholderia sp.]